jgi:1A family penicillin-binding protein
MQPVFIARNFKKLSKHDKWKIVYKTLLWFCGLSVLFVLGIFIFFAKDLPNPGKINNRHVVESTKIFDRTGQHLLYEIHGEEKRTLVEFKDIPDSVKYATIALEDQDFYNHHGIKLTSIMRSALKDVVKGGAAQGGSTITQQFIKKAILSDEKTITRKIKEVILAIEIEQKFDKDEILGMYLNEIPYGSNAYGVEAAAQTFFNKSARDLGLDEAAIIAALPQAPTRYSPYGSHTDELKHRQELAIQKMADLGYITQEQADEAKESDVLAKIAERRESISAPHFVMYVKEYLETTYGGQVVEQGGLKVYTTLDWDKQQIAEAAVRDGVDKNKSWNASNAALVAADPKTGQILAMVGSKDYFDKSIDGQVNVAIRDRQPGSSFKPFVYLTAFTKGYTPETILFDAPINFGTEEGKDYRPQNYNGNFTGPIKMKESLPQSLNVPAVEALYLAGVKNSIELAKKLGITGLNQPERYGLSLVLGGGEVKLVDHVNAYGTIANGGVHQTKTAILRVEDNKGEILEEFKQSSGDRVVEEKYIAMLEHVMSTNDYRAPVFGSNSPLRFDSRPVAAKTGTTNEFRDGWTIGFTPSLVVGVWAGNNDNSAMKVGADGVNVAAPIWRKFLDQALGNYAIEQFPKYEKEETGKPILDGNMDSMQENVKVCKIDKDKYKDKIGKYCLANSSCPDDAEDKKDFSTIHNILWYANRDDPRGDYPKNPEKDPQFKNWEKGVREWYADKGKKSDSKFAPTEECKSEYFSGDKKDDEDEKSQSTDSSGGNSETTATN